MRQTPKIPFCLLAALCVLSVPAAATTYYVDINSPDPTPPYASWSTAATNIQDAINAVVVPGGIVLVSNGVYNTSSTTSPDGAQNRVAVTLPVILESFNGPAVTFINGGATCRCVYLTNSAVLNGFTLTNGSAANGGGVYAASTNATITNCIIKYCSAGTGNGGGAYSGTFYNCSLFHNSGQQGGGAFGGVFDNCTIANNSATAYGGGAYSGVGSPLILENCIIVSNSASAGGGVFNFPSSFPAPPFDCLTNSFVTNCVISYNSAGEFGGATVDAYLDNCTVSSNRNSYVAVAAGYLVGCTFIGNQVFAARPNVSDLLNDSAEVLSNCTLIANGGGVDDCQAYGCTLLQNNGVGALYSTLVNCLISSNTAAEDGGGANNCTLTNCTLTFNQAVAGYYGGGAYQSTLQNCTLMFNQANEGGGADDCTLNNCTLAANAAGQSGGGGGGGAEGSTLNQCLILQNIATNQGGGVLSCSLNSCLVISNTAALNTSQGGGAYNSTLTNCVLAFNVATNGGGAYDCTLVNCSAVANSAVIGGGVFQCMNYNSILYYNINGDFYPSVLYQYPINYCCSAILGTNGVRNITTPPLFVNLAGGDYHLQSSSPCINSGNNAYISSATDLDGNPRIQGGTVDIGAYEYQTPTSVISYAYLQQYGLPTDGSVDFADLDGTGFNVYQDWIAGLNPTNSASVLAMLTPVTTNTTTGVTVTWQSVSGISYFLQRSTNLVSLPSFVTIQNNITGQTDTTSYTDTSATNDIPYFYRVGVVAP